MQNQHLFVNSKEDSEVIRDEKKAIIIIQKLRVTGMARMSITKITIVGKTGPLDLELMFNHLS